ncbi:hypothetical protein DL765_002997 [Monosporascus sp. GIB2]|nr:hypothetical protein DL765_002997 [Monosporascus sp. GIB2]
MAEAVGLTASIVTILDLSGKILAYLRDVKDGPKDCNRLKLEVRSTEGILKTLKETVEDAEAEPQEKWSTTIRTLNKDEGPLKQLEEVLHTLNNILEKTASATGLRRIHSKFLWPFKKEDTKKWLDDIERQKSFLLLALENDHLPLSRAILKNVKDGFQKWDKAQDDHELHNLLKWLAPIDFASQQSDFINRRQAGTGQWLLDSPKFHEWIQTDKQTLFCPGIPGAGKTILTSVVVDELSTRFRNDESIGIAYLYCNFRRQHEQNAVNLLTKSKVNIFATSRYIPEITEKFKGSISLEIRASNEDVRKYLNGHMFRLPGFVNRSPELQEEIKTDIVQSVQGMFLLAQLHLDSLIGKRSAKAVRTALAGLPTGSGAYDHAYNDAMERIEGQVKDQEELAKQVLSWITCARRPLATPELQHALAVELGTELDKDNIPDIEDIISVCAGLVTVDEESGIIRLVHYTTQLYFERMQRQWFPNGPTDVAATCLTYLSFDIFESGFCLTDSEFEKRLQSHPLYGYAACNWGYHACEAPKDVIQLAVCFLDNAAKVSAASQALMATNGYSGYSQRVPQKITGLHLAAYFGLWKAVLMLLHKGHLPAKDTNGQTPLFFAAANGHEEAVALLLSSDTTDPNPTDKYDRTPVSWAAENGHSAVVKRLLAKQGVDPNFKDKYDQTPLSWATANGHTEVVKLFSAEDHIRPTAEVTVNGTMPLMIAARDGNEMAVRLVLTSLQLSGIHPDGKDKDGRTALSCAAETGHEAVVRLLLAEDSVDPDSRDNSGRTPLIWAAKTDGVNPDAEDKQGRTTLFWAVSNGHGRIIELLLARDGVNPNAKDNNGLTPLSWAKDIDPDLKDHEGRTPLSWAAEWGHEGVVKLLLAKKDVDPDSKDNNGRSPLSYATEGGREEVVKLLLGTKDVNLDSKDKEGRTPLSWAAQWGYSEVVKLLLVENINADSEDNDGRTPASWASAEGHGSVLKLLLARKDVDADSKDANSRTPLSWAAQHGRVTCVKILFAIRSADPDSKDAVYGRTPLSWAAENGHEAVVQLLLAVKAVNRNSKDTNGWTPLFWASRYGQETVLQLLLNQEVDAPSSSSTSPIPYVLLRRFNQTLTAGERVVFLPPYPRYLFVIDWLYRPSLDCILHSAESHLHAAQVPARSYLAPLAQRSIDASCALIYTVPAQSPPRGNQGPRPVVVWVRFAAGCRCAVRAVQPGALNELRIRPPADWLQLTRLTAATIRGWEGSGSWRL